MPNQLTIPFKKTYVVPIRDAVRQYILSSYRDTHPDAYRWDIAHWETLRKDGTGGTVHVDRVQTTIRYLASRPFYASYSLCALRSYHAQLVFILTKLPPDVGGTR